MNLCHLIGNHWPHTEFMFRNFPEDRERPGNYRYWISPAVGIRNTGQTSGDSLARWNWNRSELLPKVGSKGSYWLCTWFGTDNKNFPGRCQFSVPLNKHPLVHFGERSNKSTCSQSQTGTNPPSTAKPERTNVTELTKPPTIWTKQSWKANLPISLQQAEENRRVSKSQYEVGLETLSGPFGSPKRYGNRLTPKTKVDARFQLYLNYVASESMGTLHDKL